MYILILIIWNDKNLLSMEMGVNWFTSNVKELTSYWDNCINKIYIRGFDSVYKLYYPYNNVEEAV